MKIRTAASIITLTTILSACGKDKSSKSDPESPSSQLEGAFSVANTKTIIRTDKGASGVVYGFLGKGENFAYIGAYFLDNEVYLHLYSLGTFKIVDGKMVPTIRKSCALKAGTPVSEEPVEFKRQGEALTLKGGLFSSGIVLTKNEDGSGSKDEKEPKVHYGCFVETSNGHGFLADPSFKTELVKAGLDE